MPLSGRLRAEVNVWLPAQQSRRERANSDLRLQFGRLEDHRCCTEMISCHLAFDLGSARRPVLPSFSLIGSRRVNSDELLFSS
jgi:hypothetical protein